jgi:hypothetical protein
MINNEIINDAEVWNVFLSRIKEHLHIILVFSMLAFTALRTESTIDWYMPWSINALESVAFSAFSHSSIGSPDVVKAVVNICVKIHKSVEEGREQVLR